MEKNSNNNNKNKNKTGFLRKLQDNLLTSELEWSGLVLRNNKHNFSLMVKNMNIKTTIMIR